LKILFDEIFHVDVYQYRVNQWRLLFPSLNTILTRLYELQNIVLPPICRTFFPNTLSLQWKEFPMRKLLSVLYELLERRWSDERYMKGIQRPDFASKIVRTVTFEPIKVC